jgi:hypothetical protein
MQIVHNKHQVFAMGSPGECASVTQGETGEASRSEDVRKSDACQGIFLASATTWPITSASCRFLIRSERW